MKTAIVAPVHITPSENWVNALERASDRAKIIIVDDSNGAVKLPATFDVYDYARQREEMGDDLYERFEIFHKSSSCKMFGMWLAYMQEYDIIIVIDSDCIIPPDFIAGHQEALLRQGSAWSNPLEGSGWYSRGFPYSERNRKKWAHMGLWENELDLYGAERVARMPSTPPKCPPERGLVSAPYFPLSGMNVSFIREAVPYMLFLPNFVAPDGNLFRRHDDIWGGYIFQKFAHELGGSLSYGNKPTVFHDTVVDAVADAREEEPMLKYEDKFMRAVDMFCNEYHTSIHVHENNPADIWDTMACSTLWLNAGLEGVVKAFEFMKEAYEL
jgi:hypothetical protein